MNAPTSHSGDCIRAWEAMPWVLQHTVTEEQARWLDEHLAHCASCRAEFRQQQLLQRAMNLPVDLDVDMEGGLQKLLARIDTPRAAQRSSWLMRGLVAAVILQAIALSTVGVELWRVDNAPLYRTLGDPARATPVEGTIRVVPEATMTLAEWNALLRDLQLRVVGGPNQIGAYLVAAAAPSGAPADLVKRLRASKGIRLAEPAVSMP